MPASTTRVTPLPTSSARSASISGTSGRETVTACTQPRRFDDSSSASGPQSVPSPAVMPEATRSVMSVGEVGVDGGLGAPVTWISKLIVRPPPRP